VIPLIANQDLMPMLLAGILKKVIPLLANQDLAHAIRSNPLMVFLLLANQDLTPRLLAGILQW